ncbi:hypothetical protein ACFP2G_03630 [Psittacicella hinzii]
MQVQQNLLHVEKTLVAIGQSGNVDNKQLLLFVESLALPLVLDQNELEFSHQVRAVCLRFQELVRKYNLEVICCARSLLEWGYKSSWVILPEENIGVHDLFDTEKYQISEVKV